MYEIKNIEIKNMEKKYFFWINCVKLIDFRQIAKNNSLTFSSQFYH